MVVTLLVIGAVLLSVDLLIGETRVHTTVQIRAREADKLYLVLD